MTLDATLTSPPERLANNTWIPPRIRQDWPKLQFNHDAVRGVVTETMGIQLSSVFQPIVDVQGKIVAEEALLRARSHGLQIPPLSVFRIAAAHGQLVAFDRLARTLHLINYLAYPRNHERLFLNVHPRLLGEVSKHGIVFEEILSSVHWTPQQVTLEFLEDDVAAGDFSQLREAAKNYRERGYGIAIDNFGGEQCIPISDRNEMRKRRADSANSTASADDKISVLSGNGISRLDSIGELQPDVVKLDRKLLLKSEASPNFRKTLVHLVGLLQQLKAQVVMEGVETLQQSQIARDAGVDLLQGFYYGHPQSIGAT